MTTKDNMINEESNPFVYKTSWMNKQISLFSFLFEFNLVSQ